MILERSRADERTTRTQVRPGRWRAAVLAIGLLVLLCAVGRQYLRAWEAQYLDQLSPTGEDDVVKGLVLTRTAVARKDDLVLFGSSELTFQDEYHPARLFATRPTGFATHLVGSGYRQNIHNLVALGALGEQLRGKRIVLFITPSWFDRQISQMAFRKNFSPLHTYEMLFTQPLSDGLQQRSGARLLSIGAPATEDPLLRATLHAKAKGGKAGRLQYYALWPLGRTYLELLRLKDELSVARLIIARDSKRRPPVKADGKAIDWPALMERADLDAQAKSRSNPWGISDEYYAKYLMNRLDKAKGSSAGDSWLVSTEYGDLQLVLDALKELKVQPLFVSLPISGPWYDFREHPKADRVQYYARVRQMIEGAGFPVVDFGKMEYEPGFMRDPWHPGWKGAVMIGRELDRFYHGDLPQGGQ